MGKKILLINVDSKIPNLALMKLSAHHKKLGDDVSFNNTDSPDVVYASVIFSKNKHLVDGLKFYYPDSKIIIGGSGYDLTLKLKDEIEFLKPDYGLYPEMDFSLGYTTRGCNRNCCFCVVPKKEGRFRIYQHPKEFINSAFDKITFLDNNILFDKQWFEVILSWCNNHNLKVWFTQGLDFRLISHKELSLLSVMKRDHNIEFAWDNLKDEKIIIEKIKLIADYLSLRQEVQFYVYVDSDQDFDSGLYRCRKLKELGTNAFIMLNQNIKKTQRLRDLARWANRKWLYWSCDYSDYGCV